MKTFEYKIFITLFFGIFVTVLGVGMVIPLLPIYAYKMGANGMEIGLMLGAFSLSRWIFILYFGKKSDNKGRKPFIILGLLCYSIIPIGFIYSKDIKTIIFIRFIQGIASAMIIPSVNAYIGEITPKKSEGKIIGIFNMSIFAGMSTGPLIGGIIKDKLGINTAMLSMSILSFLGFIFSYLFLPNCSKETMRKKRKKILPLLTILKDHSLIGLTIMRLSYTSCIGIIWGFLPILAHNEYGISSSKIGIIITLGIGISGIMHIPMGWLSDVIDRKIMIITGSIIVIISFLYFPLANNFSSLIYSNIFFGLGGGLITPTIMASTIVRGNKNNAMGSTMAILTMGHSIGMLIGSFLAGYMMDFLNLKCIFYAGTLIMIIGILIFYTFTKEEDLKHCCNQQ